MEKAQQAPVVKEDLRVIASLRKQLKKLPFYAFVKKAAVEADIALREERIRMYPIEGELNRLFGIRYPE